MDDALSEITDLLICGKTVDGWRMENVLDCWLNDALKPHSELAQLLNVFAEDGSAPAFWLNALEWQHKLVKQYFPAEKVREKAEEMARDSAEDFRMESKP